MPVTPKKTKMMSDYDLDKLNQRVNTFLYDLQVILDTDGSVSDIQDPIINTCVHVTFPTNENTPIYKPYYTVIINYKQLYVAP